MLFLPSSHQFSFPVQHHGMIDALRTCEADAKTRLAQVLTLPELEAWEIAVLGRKGELAGLLKGMAGLSSEERPQVGIVANEVKTALELALAEKKTALASAFWTERLERERADVTESGKKPALGHTHIVQQAIHEITTIFERAGFARTRHPEADWDFYAFEGLNMPKDHPARDEWETFFVSSPNHPELGKMVLTPHTSNAQVREMQKGVFPIRVIDIGKCYRRQSDATHVPMFHQFEGLFIDKDISITNLLGILDYFVKAFFGPERRTRLRPFHFRFTEPSFEIDISCAVCGGEGTVNGDKCRMCKRGWLELGGAGMVHPNVLKAGGVDPTEYTGFAFGWGVERTYLMKEGMKIDDLRVIYKNDVRFLEQF